MRKCYICSSSWSDAIDVCPADGVPLELSAAEQRLFIDPERYYFRGPGGVDWMETTLTALDQILAVVPDHMPAES